MLRLLALLLLAACAAAPEEHIAEDDLVSNEPRNPVVPASQGGVADPGVSRARDGRFYMVSTGGSRGMFPIRVSDDLQSWQHVGYVFPKGTAPSWYDSAPWAPEMHDVDGRSVVYFSAKSKVTGKMALGVATSDSPLGPFKDIGAPILAETPIGAIDPSYFRDPLDGRQYLLWKQESNGMPPNGTPLFIQELTADGTSFANDERFELMRNELPWEGNLVEAPWMVMRNGSYYLFYSANAFFDHRYATGVARSPKKNVSLHDQLRTQPKFEKHGDPILSSTASDCWQGPGHGSVLPNRGADWYVFHAWQRGHVAQGNPRLGMIARVAWENGWPAIHFTPQDLAHCAS